MFRVFRFMTILAATALVSGCADDNADESGTKDNPGRTGGNNDTGSAGGGTDIGDTHDPQGTGDDDTANPQGSDDSDSGAICFELDQSIDKVTSRVMLLEDMSTSMEDSVDGSSDGESKWSVAVNAITSMVTTYEASIEFGLDLFPVGGPSDSQASCEIGSAVLVDVAYDNAATIIQTMDDEHTDDTRATPLLAAMQSFLDAAYAPGFTNGEPGGYLVVISDGMDTCGTDGVFSRNDGATEAELREVTSGLLAAGIQTFVIGFGGGIDPDQLNAIAEAGGTAFTTYFDAQNEEELNEALDSIGQAVIVSCQYQLSNVPEGADRALTNIYFDGQGLLRGESCSDAGAGWIWGDDDMTIIEFCPDACASLESGAVEQLRVVMACSPEDVLIV